jgi:uncharacterized membrane protein YqjE
MSENSQSNSQQRAEGLLGSIKSITALAVAIAHNRLNLLSADLEMAREQTVSVLMMVLVALFCLCFGALLLALFVVVIFWDTHRLIALGSMTGLFVLIGALCLWRVIKALKAMPATFEASLAELAKDYKALKADD